MPGLLFLIDAAGPISDAMHRLNAILTHAVDPCRADRHTITVCGRGDGESPSAGRGGGACMILRWRANGRQAGFPPGLHAGPQ